MGRMLRVRVRMLRTGAQDFMLKPFLKAELHARVENLIRASRTRLDLMARVTEQSAKLTLANAELLQRQEELRVSLESMHVANQIVRRTSRLIRVRRLMCLLSILCVFSLPT